MAKNLKMIKTRYAYTCVEIAELLDVHPGTVKAWIKEGLSVVENSFPYLIIGAELKSFLKKRIESRRCRLALDEFYCTKCRAPRRSHIDQIEAVPTGKTLGNGQDELMLKGLCIECGTPLNRISFIDRVKEILAKYKAETQKGVTNG